MLLAWDGEARWLGWVGKRCRLSYVYDISLGYIIYIHIYYSSGLAIGEARVTTVCSTEKLQLWTRCGSAHGPADQLGWNGFVYGQAAAAPTGQLVMHSFVHGQAAAAPTGQLVMHSFVHGQAAAVPKGQPSCMEELCPRTSFSCAQGPACRVCICFVCGQAAATPTGRG